MRVGRIYADGKGACAILVAFLSWYVCVGPQREK